MEIWPDFMSKRNHICHVLWRFGPILCQKEIIYAMYYGDLALFYVKKKSYMPCTMEIWPDSMPKRWEVGIQTFHLIPFKPKYLPMLLQVDFMQN
jgi:hypothetical protein